MLIKVQGHWEAMALSRVLEQASDKTLFMLGKSAAWATDLSRRIRDQVYDSNRRAAEKAKAKDLSAAIRLPGVVRIRPTVKRITPAFVLSAALFLSGCDNPNHYVEWLDSDCTTERRMETKRRLETNGWENVGFSSCEGTIRVTATRKGAK